VFRILVWFLGLVAVELAIALFMLGSWLIEGRRRAEEIDRLTELWRAGRPDHDPRVLPGADARQASAFDGGRGTVGAEAQRDR
jgi:hypothetical protein